MTPIVSVTPDKIQTSAPFVDVQFPPVPVVKVTGVPPATAVLSGNVNGFVGGFTGVLSNAYRTTIEALDLDFNLRMKVSCPLFGIVTVSVL